MNQHYANTVSHKESLRRRAKRLGFKIHISHCKSGMCSVTGVWHVAIAGNGRYQNNLSLDDAEALLAEWSSHDV
jgi:hypothetical protein